MDPATLFKHLLNLHVFPAMSTAPNHPAGNTIPASRQQCNESSRIKKGHVGNVYNGSLPALSFFAWRVWLRDETRKLCNHGDFHITNPTGEKPQTGLQRPEINATLPMPVIPWQHPAAQMETLGNKKAKPVCTFPADGWWKAMWAGHGSPKRFLWKVYFAQFSIVERLRNVQTTINGV